MNLVWIIVILVILVILIILLKKKIKSKSCVCLICYKPNIIWFEFLSTFIKYDVYVIVDDNIEDYSAKYSKFKNINIVQIKDEVCESNGFTNMNFIINKTISGWEKAMYYFSTINTEYEHIWFFEDDVFFYNEDSLCNIDSKYPNSDLLSSPYEENISGQKNYWHWGVIDMNFLPPYYSAMVCCIRVSSCLLSQIKKYASKYKTLFFLEALFPTTCKKYKLQYDTPYELKNIVWRKDYTDEDINKTSLYHPVKDITKHEYYRHMLN